MIRLEHVITASPGQMEFVVEGMRNPMNSWDKGDSNYFCFFDKCPDEETCTNPCGFNVRQYKPVLGNNDESLMRRLSKAGTDHRKFMRQMPVYVRITAPLYWWKEFDTYKVGTVSNSCSTMHKIGSKKFEMSDFSTEHLLPASYQSLGFTIKTLNEYRDIWQGFDGFKDEHHLGKNEEPDKKDIWWQMIQLLPSSYNQTRNVSMNYEVLANIYKSRKAHKLDEWREFCSWIETLPYSYLITGKDE